MIQIGSKVTKIEICKTDNYNDQNIEGYEVSITFDNKEVVSEFRTNIPELEDRELGIYLYIDNEYKQIENWGK